jgi:hypothetical protein
MVRQMVDPRSVITVRTVADEYRVGLERSILTKVGIAVKKLVPLKNKVRELHEIVISGRAIEMNIQVNGYDPKDKEAIRKVLIATIEATSDSSG